MDSVSQLRIWRGLVALLVGVLLGGFAVSAFASLPKVSVYRGTLSDGTKSPWRYSAAEALGDMSAHYATCRSGYKRSNLALTTEEASRYLYSYDSVRCSDNFTTSGSSALDKSTMCPENSTGSSSCTCDSGFEEWGQTCKPVCSADQIRDPVTGACQYDCSSKSGQSYTGYILATQSPTTVNAGGCEAVVLSASNQCAVDGVQMICGTWQWTGQQGDQNQPSPSAGTAPMMTCPAGQVPGTVNGSTVCVAASPSNPATSSSSSTTVNSDGSTSTTTSSSSNNGTSTTTTTTTSTTIGGQTSTSTTTSSSSGNVGQGGEGDDKPAPFCEENPDSPICKNSTASANCNARQAAAVDCDGDAVSCEILKKQAQLACSLDAQEDGTTQLGDQVVSGQDPQDGQFPWHASQRDTRDLPTALDQSTFLTPGGGLKDVTFDVKGQTFTIPFSNYQWVLELLGNILVGIALIVGARITFG